MKKKDSFLKWLDAMDYVRTGDEFYGPGYRILTENQVCKQYRDYLNYNEVKNGNLVVNDYVNKSLKLEKHLDE